MAITSLQHRSVAQHLPSSLGHGHSLSSLVFTSPCLFADALNLPFYAVAQYDALEDWLRPHHAAHLA
jgi:hypothetical protein